MKLELQKFGGRGASSIKISLPKAQARLERLGEKMARLSREYSNSFSRENPNGNSKIQNEYLKAQKEYSELRDKINKELDKNIKTNTQSNARTFVNSYGEATTRNITTTTYEREKRRRKKAIERNLGL